MAAQNPSLERFVTLSPIPGFRSWLDNALQQHRESGESTLVRLAPDEANDLQLLYPASSNGHIALQQLLKEMFGAGARDAVQEAERAGVVQHSGDLLASSVSSCCSASYLRPVSTADGAALPCIDDLEEEAVHAEHVSVDMSLFSHRICLTVSVSHQSTTRLIYRARNRCI